MHKFNLAVLKFVFIFSIYFSSTVRVVKSYEAGAGKSFCIKKVGDKLGEILKKSKVASNRIFRSVDTEPIITTSLQGTIVDQDDVVKELLPFDKKKNDAFPRIFHFDIASSVSFAFSLYLLEVSGLHQALLMLPIFFPEVNQ